LIQGCNFLQVVVPDSLFPTRPGFEHYSPLLVSPRTIPIPLPLEYTPSKLAPLSFSSWCFLSSPALYVLLLPTHAGQRFASFSFASDNFLPQVCFSLPPKWDQMILLRSRCVLFVFSPGGERNPTPPTTCQSLKA